MMMNTKSVILVAAVLGACALGTAATAQEIEWERVYSEENPFPWDPADEPYYSGRHILPMTDGGYVVTSATYGGFMVTVARFDSEGLRLWERSVRDRDTNIYGTRFGHTGELVKFTPRFSYVRDDGRVVFFGNEGGPFGLSSAGYGFVYQLVLDEETGTPLDTITGYADSAIPIENGSAVCRMRDGRFVDAVAWLYSRNLDTLGRIAFQRLTRRGRADTSFGYYWHSVGERAAGEEVYHYPWRVIQTPDDGFMVYGARVVVPTGPATLFLLKLDIAGGKVWEAQTEPERVGGLAGRFFDTTADGGYILLGTVSYRDTAAERKRWRVLRLVKFSSEGVEEWSRDYASGRDWTTANSVRQTADGGYLLLATAGGFNEAYTQYIDSLDDAFLLKTDGEGREEWRKTWGGPDRENLHFMLPLADGSMIVTGNGGEDDQLYLAKIRIGTSGVAGGEEPAGTFTVIPNPARDRLQVVWRSARIGERVAIRLFDLLGRDVMGNAIPLSSSGSAGIDVSGLPVGTYRAVVDSSEGNVLAVRSVMIVR